MNSSFETENKSLSEIANERLTKIVLVAKRDRIVKFSKIL